MRIRYNQNFECVKEYIQKYYNIGERITSSELLHGIEKEYKINIVIIFRYLKWLEKMGYLISLPEELKPKNNRQGKPPRVYILVKKW